MSETSREPGYFGLYLKTVRQQESWTQVALARKFGREQAWISRWENTNIEGRLPPPTVLRQLSELLNTPMTTLILSAYGLADQTIEIDIDAPRREFLSRLARLVGSSNLEVAQQAAILCSVDAVSRWVEVAEQLDRCLQDHADRRHQEADPAT